MPEIDTAEAAGRQSAANNIQIKTLRPEDHEKWDSFLSDSPEALPTQYAAWRQILNETYHYPCYYHYAQQDERVVGVLPMYLVNSPITGRRLGTTPGAICAQTPQVAQALIEQADTLAKELDVAYLVLRDSRHNWAVPGLEVVMLHKGLRLALLVDAEAMWNTLRKDIRYHVRHGRKQAELHIETDQADVGDFYDALLRFSRSAGTPLFSFDFLERVTDAFTGSYQITNVYLGKKAIAGYFSFIRQRTIYGMWGGALPEYRQLKITHQATWAMIEAAIRQGAVTLDMGRSAYPSSQFDFKSQWGTNSYPIYQLYCVYKGKRPRILGIANAEEGSGPFAHFQKIWKKLPASMERHIGPYLRWHIPFG